MNISGKTALVTGAGKRVGRAIAVAVAKQGANVAVHYHHSETEAKKTAVEIAGLGVHAEIFRADLTDPLAKIRWTVRTSGFHQVRPIVKLADGTWLVGDQATGPELDFNQRDVSIADLRWLKLDIARVVAVGNWVEHPDLSKVDEVGFADLMPGSGHGPGGYVNVGRIEVYGRPVKR